MSLSNVDCGNREKPLKTAEALRRRMSLFLLHESGATAVVAALLFPVLVGGMGLGAEVGYWYMTQRKLQHAADVSAHAGAVRMRNKAEKPEIDAAAIHIAREAGARGSVTVNVPPVSGAYAGNTKSVEVLLSETHPRLFSSLFGAEPLTLGARAVVRLDKETEACVLSLSTTAAGAVTVSGSSTVTLTDCSLVSNSDASDALAMSGSGQLETDCVYTVGGADVTSGLTMNGCNSVRTNAPPIADPYADVEEPVPGPDCKPPKVNASTKWDNFEQLPNGVDFVRFCKSGLEISGDVTFRSNTLYIINGGTFRVNGHSKLEGTGVTFYFMNGASLDLNGTATVNFSAPTSGPYAGLLFFGERNAAQAADKHSVNGTSGSTFTGAIYFPASRVQYSGDSSLSGCTQIIGDTVEFTGNANITSNCIAPGMEHIETSYSLKLAE